MRERSSGNDGRHFSLLSLLPFLHSALIAASNKHYNDWAWNIPPMVVKLNDRMGDQASDDQALPRAPLNRALCVPVVRGRL